MEIIESKYGGWRRLSEQRDNNTKISLWWKDLKEIRKFEEWGGMFKDCFNWEVGDGINILFWTDNWVGSGALKDRILRLYSLSVDKDEQLFNCGDWVDEVWVWNFPWRKDLFD